MVLLDQIGIALGAVMILTQFSMLYRDNLFFRWGTRLVVGFAMADSLAWAMWGLNYYVWEPSTEKGQWWWWLGVPLGLMLYTRLSRPHAWISKYPLGVQLGVGVGTVAVGMLRTQILDQITFTVKDVFTAVTPMEIFNALIILIGVVTVVSYFFFTREHVGVLGYSAYIGRIFIMASIAVIWAGDFMWAMAMLAGVLYYLINDFIKGLLLGAAV